MKLNERNVKGYEGLYTITDKGDVFSVRRGIVLKPRTGNHGYKYVNLWKNKTPKTFLVHRLVMEAFRRPLVKGDEVNHLNGVKTDNRVENLEITDRSGNQQHKYDNGLAPLGESHHKSKLTENQVREIRALYNQDKITQPQICEKYGISLATAHKVVRYKTWRHVKCV